MSDCCNEYKCKRKKPILVRRGALSGHWVVITDYTQLDNGIISSNTKHDVTDDLVPYLISQGWTPPLDEPVGSVPLNATDAEIRELNDALGPVSRNDVIESLRALAFKVYGDDDGESDEPSFPVVALTDAEASTLILKSVPLEEARPTKESIDAMIAKLPVKRVSGENEWFTYLDVNDLRDALLAAQGEKS
jgi:hypothetical protein